LLDERPMEIRDGFIVGIFNYCDSWCAACAFTSRCRVFADMAEEESAADPNLKAIVEAPLLPQDIPPPPPEWMQGLLQEMNRAACEAATDTRPDPPPRREILPEHEGLREHAEAYLDWVYTWLRTHDAFAAVSEPDDPRAVVKWFYSMIYVKVRRALHGLAEDHPAGRDWPADHDGSAKVALLAVERSQAAWLQIIERGHATWKEAEPFIRQLLWLRDEIERVFPNARAFVRPGFDEPDEVAKLIASERV
jgi:hypothetical protein